MKTIVEYLKQLDLSDIEARLYLTLIEGGPMRVRELAEMVGLKRTTAYSYIDLLVGKGLVTVDMKESGTRIKANPPQSLGYLVDEKLQTAKKLHEQFPTILHNINISFLQSQASEETEIGYFKGINSARKIYEEALRADELRSYIWIDKKEPLFPSNATVFSNAFRENKKLKIWEIIYDPDSSSQPSKESRSHKDRYFYKYMPKSQKLSSEDILIYDGKVAVVNFRGRKTSIVLQSRDLCNNFKEIFDLLWNILPEPKLNDL